jgi:hypothetical protein
MEFLDTNNGFIHFILKFVQLFKKYKLIFTKGKECISLIIRFLK